MEIDRGYTLRLNIGEMLLFERRSNCCEAPIYAWPELYYCVKCNGHNGYHMIDKSDRWTDLLQIMG